ncbi:MAG: 50S ribosomal protein L10 [Thermodesulfobacteriota bacterium]
MNRDEKVAVVEELSSKLANAKLAVVSDYRGLTVPVISQLRRELKQQNAEIRVAKNTLMRIAIKGTPFEPLDPYLEGTTAVTLASEDPVAPAKVLVDFIKANPKLEIKKAVLDGKLLSADDLTALSKLPGKNELRAQLLGVLLAVPTSFVRVLSAVPQKALYALQAIKDQKEQNAN